MAYRDEHIEYKALPMMQGVADRINMIGLSKKFNIIQELHKDELGAKFTVIHLYGTIFSRYDRELARILQDNNDFEDIIQQDRFVAQQMDAKISQFDQISAKWTQPNFYEIPDRNIVSINNKCQSF